MGTIFIDFNDTETITRPLHLSEETESGFLDTEPHLYQSYGTYYPSIKLWNNITSTEMNLTIEVEQCVTNFQIFLANERHVFSKKF